MDDATSAFTQLACLTSNPTQVGKLGLELSIALSAASTDCRHLIVSRLSRIAEKQRVSRHVEAHEMGRGEGHCVDGAAEADCEQRTATPEVLAADKIINKVHTGSRNKWNQRWGGRRVWREALKVFCFAWHHLRSVGSQDGYRGDIIAQKEKHSPSARHPLS